MPIDAQRVEHRSGVSALRDRQAQSAELIRWALPARLRSLVHQVNSERSPGQRALALFQRSRRAAQAADDRRERRRRAPCTIAWTRLRSVRSRNFIDSSSARSETANGGRRRESDAPTAAHGRLGRLKITEPALPSGVRAMGVASRRFALAACLNQRARAAPMMDDCALPAPYSAFARVEPLTCSSCMSVLHSRGAERNRTGARLRLEARDGPARSGAEHAMASVCPCRRDVSLRTHVLA